MIKRNVIEVMVDIKTNLTDEQKEQIAQVEKSMKGLKTSYEMYEKTKKETARVMKTKMNDDGTRMYSDEDIKKQLELIENAQDAVVQQYTLLGGDAEDIKKKTSRKKSSNTTIAINQDDFSRLMKDMEEAEAVKKEKIQETEVKPAIKLEQDYIPAKEDYSSNSNPTFDVIPLPSKGEGYKDKISKAAVAYLTAYDENMIVSPNLYKDNLILDYLLEEKVLSKEIEPMDLLEGDRDAIILFLRASGYGNEYPITATDDATGKEFDTVVNLSKLKYKDFTLKGDSNGWFSFTLPVSKKEVKFRFPTHRDNITLQKMQDAEDKKIKKGIILNYVENMDNLIEDDDQVTKEDRIKVRQAIRTIENWGKDINDDEELKFNHTLTNRLNLLIMAVDGITDKKYIYDFIRKMTVRDSSALRKYISDNEPGIDYNITVDRPQSLGGGSFTTFLQLDQFIFLNIA